MIEAQNQNGMMSLSMDHTVIEQIKGTIILREIQSARAVELQAINGAGQPMGAPAPATAAGDAWKVPVGDATTTRYQIRIVR